ncbi:MAG TPA: hypothetical protein VFW99_01900 [Candidatus Nitrosotalea sp.]|nr:hypothetical protein [Candidatus Nitrosotalea sp.]
MSEDLAGIIEEIIKSGKGDVARLQNILTAIKNSEPVSFEDHQYIETLTQPQPNQVPSDTTPDVTGNVSEIPSTSSEISEHAKKSLSKKYASIGIIVAIIIIAYVGLDVYAVNNLQFRPHHGQQTAISDTEITIQTDACNPSYFPATFTTYEIDAYYNSDIIEKATVGGSTLSPKSAATLDGIFAINKQAVNKIGQTNATFDPTKATITTTVSAPIFGFIPYSIDKKYDALDFQNRIKNPPPGTFDCFP